MQKKIIDTLNSLYNLCGLKNVNIISENEGKEYCASYYKLKNWHIIFRLSKKTPIKSGSFVTMWQRLNGVTKPYDQESNIDFFVINYIHNNKIGQFIFPKQILIEKNIFSRNYQGGKRAMRIYSPWDQTDSLQATKTKEWQVKYFVDITNKADLNINLVKKLYSI